MSQGEQPQADRPEGKIRSWQRPDEVALDTAVNYVVSQGTSLELSEGVRAWPPREQGWKIDDARFELSQNPHGSSLVSRFDHNLSLMHRSAYTSGNSFAFLAISMAGESDEAEKQVIGYMSEQNNILEKIIEVTGAKELRDESAEEPGVERFHEVRRTYKGFLDGREVFFIESIVPTHEPKTDTFSYVRKVLSVSKQTALNALNSPSAYERDLLVKIGVKEVINVPSGSEGVEKLTRKRFGEIIELYRLMSLPAYDPGSTESQETDAIDDEASFYPFSPSVLSVQALFAYAGKYLKKMALQDINHLFAEHGIKPFRSVD